MKVTILALLLLSCQSTVQRSQLHILHGKYYLVSSPANGSVVVSTPDAKEVREYHLTNGIPTGAFTYSFNGQRMYSGDFHPCRLPSDLSLGLIRGSYLLIKNGDGSTEIYGYGIVDNDGALKDPSVREQILSLVQESIRNDGVTSEVIVNVSIREGEMERAL